MPQRWLYALYLGERVLGRKPTHRHDGSNMTDSTGQGIAALLEEALSDTGAKERVAHLVLNPEWPIALCGANVSERFGMQAPAMDRCVDCLKIAVARGLGRPGWKRPA